MNYKLFILSFFVLILAKNYSVGQNNNDWNTIIGSAMLENKSYEVLGKICDEAGGRAMGTVQNEKAMQLLETALNDIGYKAVQEKFKTHGWLRGDDEVIVKAPFLRKLKAVTLGFVDSYPTFEAEVVNVAFGYEEDYKNIDVKDKIVLVTRETPPGKDALYTLEIVNIALAKGAKAVMCISEKPGTLVISRSGNYYGTPIKIPVINLSYEEGKWLQRLIDKKIKVSVQINIKSKCKEIETANVVATLPGKVKETIVVGAHFDSGDLGQGAVDNGQGSAILFDIARIFKKYFPDNYYTINFVWFNGEEMGLVGSKKYLDMHTSDKLIAMVNMDMTGIPQGFNCMGFDEFIPFLKNLTEKLNGYDLNQGVVSTPWTNSDHQAFYMKGIPSFAVMGHLEEPMYKYYHELGDTYDKVNIKYITEAVAVIGILVKELANNRELNFRIRTEKETIEMLTKANVDKTLKRQGEWYYKQ